jgi:hypothetical protein
VTLFLISVLVIVVLVLINVGIRRYGERDRPGGGWQRTPEVFRDPSTGRIMRVWVDPGDGSRHYVPEDGPSPPGP